MISEKKNLLLLFLIFIIGLFLIFVITNTTKIIFKKREIDKQIGKLELEIRNFEEKNKNLLDLIENFKNSTFLEKEARKNLNLQKQGENVVIILKNNKKLKNIQNSRKEIIPNYKKWIEFIFGN